MHDNSGARNIATTLMIVGWVMFGLGILADIIILSENGGVDEGGLDSGPLVAVMAIAIAPALTVWSVSHGLATLIKLRLQDSPSVPAPAGYRPPSPFADPSVRG